MPTKINKPENLDKRILAVDGDIIAYRTAAVCEEHFEGAASSIIDTTLRDIATETGISNMRIYLTGSNNFRYKVAKTKPYKGNRATMVRPKYLQHCIEYLIKNYNACIMHNYEADDGIATDMVNRKAIHCGIDKDLFQIAGLHYNYVNKEWFEVSAEEAELILYRQVLMGDTSDNIPGLPRVGAKTAETIINDPDLAHEDALDYYKEICALKLPEVDPLQYFLEQKTLIEMVTNVDLLQMYTIQVEADTQGFVAHDENNFQPISNNKQGPKL